MVAQADGQRQVSATAVIGWPDLRGRTQLLTFRAQRRAAGRSRQREYAGVPAS